MNTKEQQQYDLASTEKMLFVFLTTECPLAIHGLAICKPCESHSYVGVNMGATLCKKILQPKLGLWLHKLIWAVALSSRNIDIYH